MPQEVIQVMVSGSVYRGRHSIYKFMPAKLVPQEVVVGIIAPGH